MNPLDDALAALERVTGYRPVKSGDGYKARCPCHEDRTPSLSVKMNGRLLLHCFAGCSYDRIVAALDLAPEPQPGRRELVATYSYRDAAGVEVRQKVRYAPKDFRIRHQDEAGRWVYQAGPGPAVLYCLPELRQAIARGATIFVVEGEKDCDRLAAGGLTATTNIEGAATPDQKAKWRSAYTAQLAGAARVVLLPDHDAPGRAHMQAIARALQGRVGEVRLLELPGLPAKGDVSDWLDRGHTLAELQALADETGRWTGPAEPSANDSPTRENRAVKSADGFSVCGELSATTRLACLATDEASGARIHEATDYPTVIANSTDNLWATAQNLRKTYPKLKVLVCGDVGLETDDKARIAALSLVGGSYWCHPDFLRPVRSEIEAAAVALMNPPPKPGDPIPDRWIHEAKKNLKVRDEKRIAEESPATFANLAGWFSGQERVKQQVEAAVGQISVIRIQAGKLSSIVDRAEAEMLFYGAGFYQRVGMLVRPVKQDASTEGGGIRLPAGALVLNPIDLPWLNRRFSQAAKWVKLDKRTGVWVPADPPNKYAETYLSMAGEWNVQILTGIVECPTLRRDGSLLTKSGYDKASGLYVDYNDEPVSVPESPSRDDALIALEVLKIPFAEFPFAEGDIDLSVVLAALLTTIVRRSLRTAPLFAMDAPTMGSGKGLIVNSIAMVATGRGAPAISQGKDETEDEKRIGALLLRGVPLLNIDNIERELHGDLLCSALTETAISIRILGKSEIPDMPCNLAMFATGNNIRAKGDMVRRVLLCRIDPACERPDARTFKLNLNEYIPAHRAKLLSAALTVLRAYIVAGKPKQDIPPYGSFEEWSGLVRSALVWLGMPDPNLTRARLEADDPVSTALHSILTLWFAAFGKAGMTVPEVIQQASMAKYVNLYNALLDTAPSSRDPAKVDAKRLGNWLRRYKGKVANGLRLEKAGVNTDTKTLYWRVVPLQFTGSTGSTGSDSNSARKNCKSLQNNGNCENRESRLKVTPEDPVDPVNDPSEPASPSVDTNDKEIF